jgi:hypothetical protein
MAKTSFLVPSLAVASRNTCVRIGQELLWAAIALLFCVVEAGVLLTEIRLFKVRVTSTAQKRAREVRQGKHSAL